MDDGPPPAPRSLSAAGPLGAGTAALTAVALTIDEPARAASSRRALLDALPLLVALGLLMAGTGLTSTLLGIRAGLEGFDPAITGVVLAGYYLGYLGGSLLAPSTIRRVGHVRVFAGLASLASAAVLIHVIRPEPVAWFALRGLSGLCVSGLYVVTESWLNGAATNSTRGTLLAAYMVVVTGGLAVGQLLFSLVDPAGFTAFVLASVLLSFAVVPISLATVRAPAVAEPARLTVRELVAVAPLAPVAAAISGFIGAAMLGAGTVYAAQAGLGRGGTAALISAALAGGILLQVPLGRWSDRTDRRVVITVAGLVGALASVGAALVGADQRHVLVAMTVVAGGMGFPLYSLASAHLNDWLEEGKVVAAGSKLVLVNGAGAVAGPVVGAVAVRSVGPGALFVSLAAAYLLVAAFAAYRITRRAEAPEEERSTYVAVPAGGAPAASLLQEGAVDELYPPDEGVVPTGGVAIPYREQGFGEAIVLLPDPDTGSAAWEATVPALAADGLRAIAPEARTVDGILAVLLQLGLPEASFVARASAIGVLDELVAEHPDRVHAVVPVGAPLGVATDLPVLEVHDEPWTHDEPEAFADFVVDFLRHEAGADPDPDGA